MSAGSAPDNKEGPEVLNDGVIDILPTTRLPGRRTSATSSLALETLSCDSFYDPGTSTVPFPYPPVQEDLMSCRSGNTALLRCTRCRVALIRDAQGRHPQWLALAKV